MSSETPDLHVDPRASALWEKVCGVCGYGVEGGEMGEGKVNEEGTGWEA